MVVHFTYDSDPPEGELRQGDLLEITDDLRGTLEEFHPHYANNPDYPFLIVITQSCDLAFRDGKCASRYISLAAVRHLETLIGQEIERQSKSSIEKHRKVFPENKKPWMEDFMKKLLNNNLPGYFYLEPESAFGIDSSYVAYLALSIAIKSDNYQICKEARFASLKEIFRAKLGWLVGSMYSRVATPDWIPARFENSEDFKRKISKILETSIVWVPERAFSRLEVKQEERRKETGDKSYILTSEEIGESTSEFITEQRMKQENITRFLVKETAKVIKGAKQDQLKELESKLLNNQKLQGLIA